MRVLLFTRLAACSLYLNLLLVCSTLAQASVFIAGTDGYKSFRIPAVVGSPDGQILAFAEGRVNGSGDFGDIDIVMKTSKDQGKSWSVLKVVASYDSLQAGNPSPVFDLTDPNYPKGRLFLFYNTGNNHESEVRKGKGLREVWYKTSEDVGQTWSAPVNITLQTHRPDFPKANAAYAFKEDWRSYAIAPGHGMQMTSGQGSLLMIGKTRQHHVLAFSNAADTQLRDKLTVRISYDDVKTWDKRFLIDQSSQGEKDYTAYSDLLVLSTGNLGILYEFNRYKSIVFKQLDWQKE